MLEFLVKLNMSILQSYFLAGNDEQLLVHIFLFFT